MRVSRRLPSAVSASRPVMMMNCADEHRPPRGATQRAATMRSAWAFANTLLIVVAEGGLLGVLQTPTRTSVPRATMPEGHEHHAGPLTVMPDGLEYLAGPVTCKSASVHLERHPDLLFPRMVISRATLLFSDETIDTFIEFLDEVLMEEIDVLAQHMLGCEERRLS